MSQEGDGMGDVIRKAAAPAGEGCYKKVREEKSCFVSARSQPLAGRDGWKRCPPTCQGFGCWSREQLSAV